MDQDRFRSGQLSTNYIEDEFPEGFHGLAPNPWQRDLIAATAAYMHWTLSARARMSGVGSAGEPRQDWVIVSASSRRVTRLTPREGGLNLLFIDDDRKSHPGPRRLAARRAVVPRSISTAGTSPPRSPPPPEGFVIRHRAASALVLVLTPVSADLHERLPAKIAPDTSRLVLSPMPGLVVAAEVSEGEKVSEGQVLFIIEAMKMQNIIRAERDGVLRLSRRRPATAWRPTTCWWSSPDTVAAASFATRLRAVGSK